MVNEDMRSVSSVNGKNTFKVPREYYVKILKDGKRVKDSWIREAINILGLLVHLLYVSLIVRIRL